MINEYKWQDYSITPSIENEGEIFQLKFEDGTIGTYIVGYHWDHLSICLLNIKATTWRDLISEHFGAEWLWRKVHNNELMAYL